jgi:hypothetical protein
MERVTPNAKSARAPAFGPPWHVKSRLASDTMLYIFRVATRHWSLGIRIARGAR